MKQYSRTEMLIGEENLNKLKNSHVVVCGLGAVGSYAVEALARAGVGHLRLVDYDRVHHSNINRQAFALHSTIGLQKTEVAEKRVKDINPDCRLDVLDTFIDEHSNAAIIEKPVDVMIDAIDSLSAKVHLIADAYRANIHIISSMGAAGRMNANAITTGDLSETHTCPLARSLRRRLHRREIYKGVRCIYSTEVPKKKDSGQEPHDGQRVAPVLGSISYLTAIYGLKAAYEAIDYILSN